MAVGQWLGANDAPLDVVAAQERVAAALTEARQERDEESLKVNEQMTLRIDAIRDRDAWKRHAATSDAEVAQLRERLRDANGWLVGIEETFASPNRECELEDVVDGVREGNTCIGSEPGDLDFPDDWCGRCYTLFVVREARAALSVPEPREVPTTYNTYEDAGHDCKPHGRPPLPGPENPVGVCDLCGYDEGEYPR